ADVGEGERGYRVAAAEGGDLPHFPRIARRQEDLQASLLLRAGSAAETSHTSARMWRLCCVKRAMPASASCIKAAISSLRNGFPSAVPCTSMISPPSVMTRF